MHTDRRKCFILKSSDDLPLPPQGLPPADFSARAPRDSAGDANPAHQLSPLAFPRGPGGEVAARSAGPCGGNGRSSDLRPSAFICG